MLLFNYLIDKAYSDMHLITTKSLSEFKVKFKVQLKFKIGTKRRNECYISMKGLFLSRINKSTFNFSLVLAGTEVIHIPDLINSLFLSEATELYILICCYWCESDLDFARVYVIASILWIFRSA